MKKFGLIIAAVLATCLTACSFFNNNNSIENNNQVYSCQVSLEGGSGKATVESPAEVVIIGEDKTVKLVWSSSHYDYMVVDGTRYDNEADEGEQSVFTISFDEFDTAFTVIGDTTAMSVPHEIEYTLTVYSPESQTTGRTGTDDGKVADAGISIGASKPDLSQYSLESSMELKYANQFSVDYYKDKEGNDFTLISIGDSNSAQYFTLGEEVKGATFLKSVDKTYLVSTSVMDLLCNIDALDDIAFSGTRAEDWHVTEAAKAVGDGSIAYAGKYSAPDYELLVTKGCNLAIENTMIYHNPEVKEKLEELGIPVIVERSSYETGPLGRLEWIKLYGVLFDCEDKAEAVFTQQCERAEEIGKQEKIDKKVAFFSVNSNGQITVRKSGDYISSMIDMAGGEYVPEGLSDSENALSTMKITMEDFYLGAVDADVLIYNSTIEGEINDVEQLLKKAPSLTDFKAVKNGNVYCLREDYFQKSTSVAEFIEELHLILTDSYKSGDCFYKLKE
ncbi:MAG: ABC transporter substrate-binding protein [Pseudobutyrivibrio sp.]|nr:ABC transporter substrate-binding protein [Pseudobutyrivibrio sp.]